MLAESVRIEAILSEQGRTIPRPLTGIERAVLRAADFYVSFIRRDLNGTGTVTITLDLKDHKIKSVRGGVDGPREDV